MTKLQILERFKTILDLHGFSSKNKKICLYWLLRFFDATGFTGDDSFLLDSFHIYDAQDFLFSLVQQGCPDKIYNQASATLRLFFEAVLGLTVTGRQIPNRRSRTLDDFFLPVFQEAATRPSLNKLVQDLDRMMRNLCFHQDGKPDEDWWIPGERTEMEMEENWNGFS